MKVPGRHLPGVLPFCLGCLVGCGNGGPTSVPTDPEDRATRLDVSDPDDRAQDEDATGQDSGPGTPDLQEGPEDSAVEDMGMEDGPSHGWDPPTVPPLLARHLQALAEEYLLFSGEYNIALAVRLPGGARWRGGAGTMDVRTGAPLPREPAFRIGSGAKPVVSTLLLGLVEEGPVGLDDPLGRWLPEYPNWKDITVRQILGMRSGIPDYLMDVSLWVGIVSNPEEAIPPDRLLRYVSDQPLLFPPGTECQYSNTNYLLAGLVAERATGRPAADLLEERVIRPLGLSHTYLDVGDREDPELVHGYMDPRPAFSNLGIPPTLVDLVPPELFVDDHLLDCAHLFHPSVAFTAGGVVSTPSDMATFMRALVRGEVLGSQAMEALLSFPPCRILGEQTEYGLGVSRSGTPIGVAYGHGGLIYGYTASTMDLPEADVTLSVMGGSFPAQIGGIHGEILRLVTDPPTTEPTPCAPPPDFFQQGEAGDRLEWRVRGGLNPPETPTPLGAIANVTAWIGGIRQPLFGTWASASLSSEVFGDRVTVTSFGPPRSAEWMVGEALISIDGSLVQDLTEGRVRDLDLRDWVRVVAVTMDVSGDPGSGAANHVCISGVPDWSRGGRVGGCREATGPLRIGELLRVFGTLAFTTDPVAIATYLSRLNLPRCSCLAPVGTTWNPCDGAPESPTALAAGRSPPFWGLRFGPPPSWRTEF